MSSCFRTTSSPLQWGKAGLGVIENEPSAHALLLHLLCKTGPWAAQIASDVLVHAEGSLSLRHCQPQIPAPSTPHLPPITLLYPTPTILPSSRPLFTFPGDLLTACSAWTQAKCRGHRAPQASSLMHSEPVPTGCKAAGIPLRGASPMGVMGQVREV